MVGNFLRNCQFSKVVVLFYVPIKSVKVLVSPYPYSVFGVVSVFSFSHSYEKVMISHCGLNLH